MSDTPPPRPTPEQEFPLPQTPAGPRWVTVKPPSGTPVVTFTLLGITILVFLLQMLSQLLLNGGDLPAALGMKINSYILQGQLWRLITPVFLHGSILHVLLNMYALFAFGPGLERYYGHMRLLALYLIGGFAGNVLSFIFSPANSLGSSTAIFGLLGAEGIFLYQNRRLFPGMAQRALSQIILVGIINLVIGLSPGIDNWGHIGGLIGGTLFAWFGGPLLGAEATLGGYTMVDRRESREVVVAGVGVVILFGMLTLLVILLKGR